MTEATWINGKKKVKGCWQYSWRKDAFFIVLYQKDNITGIQKKFWTTGDTPIWGNWKLLKE